MHRRRVLPPGAVVAAAVLLVVPLIPVRAEEPDGYTALRYEWVDGPPSPGKEALLRISVAPVVPVTGLTASFVAPAGVALRLDPAAPLGERGASSLGAMAAGEKRIIEFAVQAPEKGGGIVAFRFAGDHDGIRIEEGFGVPVGQVGVQPRLVDGALEFASEESGPRGP